MPFLLKFTNYFFLFFLKTKVYMYHICSGTIYVLRLHHVFYTQAFREKNITAQAQAMTSSPQKTNPSVAKCAVIFIRY